MATKVFATLAKSVAVMVVMEEQCAGSAAATYSQAPVTENLFDALIWILRLSHPPANLR